jgi:membrane protein DedA with SNARE-associated domain
MKKYILILFLLTVSTGLHAQSLPNDSSTLFQKVEQWYEVHMNYLTITALMTVESSFIPFPSEIVVPPAAYVANNPGSHLNIYLIILFATLGALIGSFVNYFLALWLGRPIVYKFADSKIGHLCLLNREKIQKAEEYFNRRGKITTFVGRFIPGIRQLISIPAGLARMNLLSFTIYTAFGAGIWNAILVILGCVAHGQADLINQYSHEIGWGIAGIVALVIVYWIIRGCWKKKRK